ncbi:MAG: U2 snRNP-associated SURP domain-containing protein [Lichina confinis]|nr:MAG: U2 snRNP-associated SURP domain-containing protein [Lichina confinis]
MAEPSDIQEFPDISNKLAAPSKKSLFERQKAEAEAKRLREEAETAAVYEDFVKSFDDDGPPRSSSSRDRPGGREALAAASRSAIGGPSRRHFAGSTPAAAGRAGGPKSGPGSLGPPPGALSRKRAHDGSHLPPRDKEQGLFAFEDAATGPADVKAVFQGVDGDEDQDGGEDARRGERVVPKPALLLSSLAPGTSPAVIKSYLPRTLALDSVRILPPTGPGNTERKSMSAVATLSKDTPASEIDDVVNSLQNRYLGCGYYLSISRHLSSAVNAGLSNPLGADSVLSSMPFGARPVPTGPGGGLSRAPPPSSMGRGGYAPPSSYGPTYGRGAPSVQVSVEPPSDLRQLRLIHKTLEALLTYGPEFEALLMSRAEVQQDPCWSWIWNPRSPGAVWYRWRLWELLSGSQGRREVRGYRAKSHTQIFEGAVPWAIPPKGLRFEYSTRLDEFVSESDYDSSEEESGDEAARRDHYRGRGPFESTVGAAAGEERAYLNPLQKAKLTHLLARLPTTNAKLRKGDVARVTAFAIQHAGEGADEVVDMIVSNIQRPLAFTSASPERRREQPRNVVKAHHDDGESKDVPKEEDDTSAAKVVALYVVSDILSSSSTSGVRHAWRYRQLFETALKQRAVFEELGLLEKKLHWGRLRSEKWKRSVGSVLSLWESWCVFPQASQDHFVSAFTNPPLPVEPTTGEGGGAGYGADAPSSTTATTTATKPKSEFAPSAKSKWKTVDEKARSSEALRQLDQPHPALTTNGNAVADDDGEDDDNNDGDEDDGNLDGEPMSDIDGEPMDEDLDGDTLTMEDGYAVSGTAPTRPPPAGLTDNAVAVAASSPSPSGAAGRNVAAQGSVEDDEDGDDDNDDDATASQKHRPRAEDMFADSDEER